MATAPPMNGRRTAVRMLQPPWLETDVPGTATTSATSPRSCTALPAQPTGLRSPSIRRRSACLPVSAADEPAGAEAGRVGSSTAPTSPGPSRRPANVDAGFGDALSPSSTSPPDAALDQESPHHLSLPLTLLSLHNGGARHSPRAASRDISPMAGLLLSREGSFCLPSDADAGDNASWGAGSGGGGGLGNPFRQPHERTSAGGSPPMRMSTGPAATPPLGSSSPIPGASGSWSPVRTGASSSVTLTPRASNGVWGPLPSAAAAASTAGGTATGSGDTPSSASAAASTKTSTSGAADAGGLSSGVVGGGGTITLPPHLCSHRPPTPVCKEDDLLNSMRHMASPSRRRSRFASAADSSLLAAAAAAIADDEAGLLESPPPSSSGAGAGLIADPRVRRAALAALSDNGSFLAGWAAGQPLLEGSHMSRHLVMTPALDQGHRVPSMSMTWRTSQLVTVLEEPAAPVPRGDAFASPFPCLVGGAGSGAGGGGASRRLRHPSSSNPLSSGDSHHGPPSATAGLRAGATRPAGGPPDDSLSSFMHSFGPGTPTPDRRCPAATADASPAVGAATAGAGRVTAR